MASDPPMTKAALLERIDRSWSELREVLVLAGESRPTSPQGPEGEQAVHHFAHVSAWERSLLALLRGEDRGAAMGLPPAIWASHDTEVINASITESAVNTTFADLRGQADAVHTELRSSIDALTPQDLFRPYSHYQPNDPPFNASPVIGWIHGNTWEHYEDHVSWLWRERYPALAAMESAPFFATFGARFGAARPGKADITLVAGPNVENPYGIPHGGVWLFLADSAMGAALATLVQDGQQVITVQFDFRWLRALAGDRLVAKGRVMRRGRQASHCEVDLVDSEGTLLGRGTGTYVVIEQTGGTAAESGLPGAS